MTVTVRYWASAREAAGTDEEQVPGVATLAELCEAVAARHGGASGRLARVLSASSFVIDEAPAGTRPRHRVPVAEGAVVEVLPPFAGG